MGKKQHVWDYEIRNGRLFLYCDGKQYRSVSTGGGFVRAEIVGEELVGYTDNGYQVYRMKKFGMVRTGTGEYRPRSSGCFVATAVFGSEEVKEVIALRHFRDSFLAQFSIGRFFIRWYYMNGPRLAALIEGRPLIKCVIGYSLVAFLFLVEQLRNLRIKLRRLDNEAEGSGSN